MKKALEERGLARGAKPHTLTLPRCQRSGGVVEPMISTQWFLKMQAMAERRSRPCATARPTIIPEEWTKTYDHFLENIQDWCVSRQLWWGHQIPAWHGPNGEIRVARERPNELGPDGPDSRWTQDQDVLDTWFSTRPLAVLDARLAGRNARARAVLRRARQRPRDGLRHPLLLGRPDDDVRASLHGRGALPAHPPVTGSSSTRPAKR